MARNNDDSVERFINEYMNMLEKCFKECIRSTTVSELTHMEVDCVKYCTINQQREPKNSTISKSWEAKKKSSCCVS